MYNYIVIGYNYRGTKSTKCKTVYFLYDNTLCPHLENSFFHFLHLLSLLSLYLPNISLAAQPALYYDCTSDDPVSLDYQMRDFSPDDRYSFNCTIRPGVMRSSYTLEWRSRRGTDRVKSHPDVDIRSFAVNLTSSNLTVLYKEDKLLECRVVIQHAPDKDRTYCGRGIRAAGKTDRTSLSVSSLGHIPLS